MAATVAHLVSVLVLKRSILTEKVARRGFHVMREYAVDPLEATFVREVMDTDVYTVDPDRPLAEVTSTAGRLRRAPPASLPGHRRHGQSARGPAVVGRPRRQGPTEPSVCTTR